MLNQRIVTHAWYHRTIPQLFAEVCAAQPGKTAIVFQERATSYHALQMEVDRLSQALLNLGVGKGDVVSTLPSPTSEFAALYLATLQIGAVVNPLNLLWGTLEFSGVLPRNAPSVIVTVDQYGGRDYLQLLREALPDLQFHGDGEVSSASIPKLHTLIAVSREGRAHEGVLDFQAWRGRTREVDQALVGKLRSEGQPTDVQFICQTSGTTGLSKSALWDHRPPLATVNFAAKALGYSEDERYLNLSPFYHNSGLFALNLNLVLSGSTLHLMEAFTPAAALDIIDRHGISATFGFEAHWQGLRRVPDFERRRFTIRKAVLAGEPTTIDLVRTMCPAGACISSLYAQTENGPLVSLSEHDCMDARISRSTHGRPLPGVEVVIKDHETGVRVPQGQAGEICYRSPYMFRGYLAQPEETRKAFDEEGYFHSGDYGNFDNGYITYLGRLGGVVKSGGENVSTTRVSTLLMDVFAGQFDDVKTVGVPDSYWGSRVVSLVRTKEGAHLPGDVSLREACKGKMAAYEIPRNFLAWEGPWPVSAEGKIDFKALQAYAQERLRAVAVPGLP